MTRSQARPRYVSSSVPCVSLSPPSFYRRPGLDQPADAWVIPLSTIDRTQGYRRFWPTNDLVLRWSIIAHRPES